MFRCSNGNGFDWAKKVLDLTQKMLSSANGPPSLSKIGELIC